MANPKNVDLTENRVFYLGTSIIFRCVCAPKDWTAEEVSNYVSNDDPPGTVAGRWDVSDAEEREGDFNGVSFLQCPDEPNRLHWLMNC